MLSGNRVYSPATAPSITTRSIWIVTFPNLLCLERNFLKKVRKSVKSCEKLMQILDITANGIAVFFDLIVSFHLSHFALILARNVKLLAFWWTLKGPCKALIPLWIRASGNNLTIHKIHYNEFVIYIVTNARITSINLVSCLPIPTLADRLIVMYKSLWPRIGEKNAFLRSPQGKWLSTCFMHALNIFSWFFLF